MEDGLEGDIVVDVRMESDTVANDRFVGYWVDASVEWINFWEILTWWMVVCYDRGRPAW